MSEDLKLPTPLYSCHHCREEYSKEAEEIWWCDEISQWVCEDCWQEAHHGLPGVRLSDELKRRADSELAQLRAEVALVKRERNDLAEELSLHQTLLAEATRKLSFAQKGPHEAHCAIHSGSFDRKLSGRMKCTCWKAAMEAELSSVSKGLEQSPNDGSGLRFTQDAATARIAELESQIELTHKLLCERFDLQCWTIQSPGFAADKYDTLAARNAELESEAARLREARCSTCAYWQKCPTIVNGCEREMICGYSKHAAGGLNGQDGRAIITPPDFGCIHWKPAAMEGKA